MVLEELNSQLNYQDEKWGTEFDDKNTMNDWIAYLSKYNGQALTLENNNAGNFVTNMYKVAGIAVAAIEAVSRNGGLPKRHYDK